MFLVVHFIIYLLDTWNEKNIHEYVYIFFLCLCKLSSYLIGVKELSIFFHVVSLVWVTFSKIETQFLRKLSKLENCSSLSVSKYRLNSCEPQRRPKFMMTHNFCCKWVFSVVAASSKIVKFMWETSLKKDFKISCFRPNWFLFVVCF